MNTWTGFYFCLKYLISNSYVNLLRHLLNNQFKIHLTYLWSFFHVCMLGASLVPTDSLQMFHLAEKCAFLKKGHLIGINEAF